MKPQPIGRYTPTPSYEELQAEIERLRLTDAEREAVRRAIDTLGGIEDLLADAGIKDDAALRSLRGLLDRF
jgi:hypothetical protein